jgi:hypothetical protein
VPLQCADVLAFEGNRRLRDTAAPVRKPLEAIDPDGDRIGFIEIDEQNMPEFIERACRLYDEQLPKWHAMFRQMQKSMGSTS